MRKITLIDLEWNNWNGFIFEVLAIELKNFEGALFGFHAAENHLIIELFFIQMEFKSPFL